MGKPTNHASAITRRNFLRKSLAAAAGPMILPRHVLGMAGQPGANDRIVTGHIGIGGQGQYLLDQFSENVGAVCDVHANHLQAALDKVGRRAYSCKDYRELLDREDIDAVVIATPDHWHGVQTVHACEAGKDVYCEKPASKTIAEGRAMMETARRYGRVVQIGSQGRSTADAHAACTYLRNGQLGAISKVACWHIPNPTGGDPTKAGEPPAELDWDLWLGPAAWRPYNPDYCHVLFRWMLDLGGGSIRDRGAHVFSVVQWCLDLDMTYPSRVTATGTPPLEGLWDVPTTMEVVFEYDNPKLTITWGQPGVKGSEHEFGAVFHGEKGNLVLGGGDGGCFVDDAIRAYVPPEDGVHPFRSPGHVRNFLDCVKSREKPVMDIHFGHRVATLCNLADISYRVGRTLAFDPESETIVNDEQANRLLHTPGRGPWHV